MKRAVTQRLGALSTYRIGVDTYDSTKLGLGKLMVQRNDAGNEGKWAGPRPNWIATYEASGNQVFSFPHAIEYVETASNYTDWIFVADSSTAAATRKIGLETYDRLTGDFTWRGYITVTFPTATNHTIKCLRANLNQYTTGTVDVSGTAVTGSSTTWSADRLCVGSRIGFGSTDPTQITTWYEISAIGTDTSITLTASAGTISSGTAYVIEDLRLYILTTNATTTNGGLFVVKGLRYENFVGNNATTIAAATTVDNIRACYWLKSAATETLTIGSGLDIVAKTSWTAQDVWLTHNATTTTITFYKFNVRSALTLTSGAATNAFTLQTAASGAVSGTLATSAAMVVATTSYTTGGGVPCIYFLTATRLYRSKPVSTITASDTTHVSGGDAQIINWPAGTTNVNGTAPAGCAYIERDSLSDTFLVVHTTAGSAKIFVTRYRSDSTPADRMLLTNEHGMYYTSAAMLAAIGGVPDSPGAQFVSAVDGVMYVGYGPTTNGGAFAVPYYADWEYADTTNARLILPAITLTDADRLNYVMAQESQTLGTSTSGYNLSPATLPYRLKYRTSGISDNSGAWTLVDQTGTLDIGAPAGGQIQFCCEFRTMGMTMWTSRLHSLAVVYDDTNTDSHYQFSADKSSAASKQFAWWFATAFGSIVPALRVRIYDSVTGSLLVDDNTTSPTGTWERSTDGTTWSAWNSTDRGNTTTYLRYTPASIADNVNARVVLTLQ